jgi:hypothetical protein
MTKGRCFPNVALMVLDNAFMGSSFSPRRPDVQKEAQMPSGFAGSIKIVFSAGMVTEISCKEFPPSLRTTGHQKKEY